MKDTLVHPWMIDPRNGLPLAALGVRANGRPIWPIMGASEDDGDGDDDEDDAGGGDDEDEDGAGDDDPWAGKSAEDLKAELARLSRTSTRNAADAKRWRERAQGKGGEGDAGKAGDKSKTSFTREEYDESVKEARDGGRASLMPALVRTAAESQLERAGLVLPSDDDARDAKIGRVIKLLDLDNIELDDNGKLIGLGSEIDALKDAYPELFTKGTKRVTQPGNNGGGKRSAAKAKTATELQAEHIFGNR